jgi:hypothetical protein
MNTKKDISVVALMVAMLFVSCYLLWKWHIDEEMQVYVSFLEEPYVLDESGRLAFVSYVSTCGADVKHLGGEQDLYESFLKANAESVKPRSLSKLTTHTNVVSSSIASSYYDGKLYGINSNLIIVNISRVGFNKDKTKAAFCFEANHSANVGIAVKTNSSNWRIETVKSIWVQ